MLILIDVDFKSIFGSNKDENYINKNDQFVNHFMKTKSVNMMMITSFKNETIVILQDLFWITFTKYNTERKIEID